MTPDLKPLLRLLEKADPVFDLTRDRLLEHSLTTDTPHTFESIDRMTIGVTSENTRTGIDKHGLIMTRLKLFDRIRYGFSKETKHDYEGIEIYVTAKRRDVISATYSDSIYMFIPLEIGTGYMSSVALVPGLSIIRVAVCYPHNAFSELLNSMELQSFENPLITSQLDIVRKLAEKSLKYDPEQGYSLLAKKVERLDEKFKIFFEGKIDY